MFTDWERLIKMFLMNLSFLVGDGRASRVCTNWREGMRQALACRDKLSFAGWRADDETVAHLVEGAWSLKELFM